MSLTYKCDLDRVKVNLKVTVWTHTPTSN